MNTNFKISGMHCQSCEKLIKIELEEIPGVSDIKVDYNAGKASVELDPDLIKPVNIIEIIKNMGYLAEEEK